MARSRVRVALFEPAPSERRKLLDGLARTPGLTVSRASAPEKLGNEQLVVFGPTLPNPKKVAEAVREVNAEIRILVAQKKPKAAAHGDGVLPLPLSSKDLAARLPEIFRAEGGSPKGLASASALVDPVTGFYVFHHFKDLLFVELKRARRYGLSLSLGLIGVDAASWNAAKKQRERLMAGIALAVRRSLRDTDYAVQYGPDRILVVMTHTELAGGIVVCDRIRGRVAGAVLTVGKQVLHPTVSIGLAAPEKGKELSLADLARRAQACVTLAMETGGNRLEFYDSVAPPDGRLPDP
ncbi:MAG: GGDEF domain-containing protein [Myxococcaceae bacterium]